MTDLITLPRATVQQALEAWEHINLYGFVLADYEGPMEQAITALKAALEQQEQEPQCNPHPNAPHGFLRNASHTEGRYVCACAYWQPYEAALEQPEPEQAEPVVPPELEAHFRHEVEAEREACAKVCDQVGDRDRDSHAYDAAAAIRARGNT
jgi:hypothetical protein